MWSGVRYPGASRPKTCCGGQHQQDDPCNSIPDLDRFVQCAFPKCIGIDRGARATPMWGARRRARTVVGSLDDPTLAARTSGLFAALRGAVECTPVRRLTGSCFPQRERRNPPGSVFPHGRVTDDPWIVFRSGSPREARNKERKLRRRREPRGVSVPVHHCHVLARQSGSTETA